MPRHCDTAVGGRDLDDWALASRERMRSISLSNASVPLALAKLTRASRGRDQPRRAAREALRLLLSDEVVAYGDVARDALLRVRLGAGDAGSGR